MPAHDRLKNLYRYNVTQSSILAKDYHSFDITGRAVVWSPDVGVYLYNDEGATDDAIAFGIIQRVFVTGYKPADIKDGQNKGRTLTVVQHGLMPGIVIKSAVVAGDLLYPVHTNDDDDKGKFQKLTIPSSVIPAAAYGVDEEGAIIRANQQYVRAQFRFPFTVQAVTKGAADGDTVVARILG